MSLTVSREEKGRRASPSVVFLNRFYSPDLSATAQMLSDLAEALSEKGWNVTVVTSRARYNGPTSDFVANETRKGVRVYRVLSTTFGRGRMLGRTIDYMSYATFAFLKLLTVRRPHVIVAMSDPPFILAVAVIAARVRRAPVFYWAQDVYPTLAAKLGVLNEEGLPFRVLSAIGRRLQRACDLVVGLGPGMTSMLISEGAPPDRTIFIDNWADEQAIRPIAPEDNWFLGAKNLQGKFVVLYSGNAGRGHTFDALCEVMRRFRDDNRIAFVFIGGGRKTNELRAYATENELPNTMFLDYVERADLPYTLSAASVSVVTEDPAVAGLLLPSKTYGILASGRPIIFIGAVNSDVANIVRTARCGVVIGHDDPDALEQAFLDLMRDSSLRSEMGKASRLAAENIYSRESATAKWVAELSRAEGLRDQIG